MVAALADGGGEGAVAQNSNDQAQRVKPVPLVPGTGRELPGIGDDFEDPAWAWQPNLPKVFNHKDDALAKNLPLGESVNRRWHEGIKRGQPDSVRLVQTPPGGLPGSRQAIALQSLVTGSTRPGNQQQQDDLIASVFELEGAVAVSRSPSVVTRVWLPPIEQWENRTGCHFAIRLSLETDRNAWPRGSARPADFDGTFWPGIFIHLDSSEGNGATGQEYDQVSIWMKADDQGKRIVGPQITQTGWWTLGMSVTPDGRVHYFAHPGVEDLTAADHIASAWPFGYRAHQFRTFFFNICNGDDGRTWSTGFVVDDSKVYVVETPTGVARRR